MEIENDSVVSLPLVGWIALGKFGPSPADVSLLNVSYDPTARALCADFNKGIRGGVSEGGTGKERRDQAVAWRPPGSGRAARP